jgi:hypothetical protein
MPATPDGAALAAQQGQNNLQAAVATSLLNQTNEVTPYGNVTYTRNQNPSMGGTGGPQNVGVQNPADAYGMGGGGQRSMHSEGFPAQGVAGDDGFDPRRPAPRPVHPEQSNNSGFNIGGIEVPSFTRTVTLSPDQQQQLDNQNAMSRDLSGLATSNIGRVRDAQNAGFNLDNLPNAVSGIDAAPIQRFNPYGQGGDNRVGIPQMPQPQYGQGGEIRSGLREFNPMQGVDTSYLNARPDGIQNQVSTQGLFGLAPQEVQGFADQGMGNINNELATGIDPSGLGDIRRDFGQQGSELSQATFDEGRALLEPQFGQAMRNAEIRLSERGLPLSSEAGGEILGGVQSQQNRALNELALSSVRAGREEQSRLFGQDMALRGQEFGELAQGAQLGNQAIGQNFGQTSAQRGQDFSQNLATQAAQNQAAAQRFTQASQTRGQQVDERLARANFANQAQQQGLSQRQSANALNNQLQQQSYNQAAGNAALQNAARQQAMQERAYVRNIPINDIAALMGNVGGVQLPNFQPSPNVAVQSADLIGASLQANKQAQDAAAAQNAASGGFMGGLMSLGGSLGKAAIMSSGFPSDIRFKENISKVGKYKGHNLYKYNYKWAKDRILGVMAQEVEKVIPDAVSEINGFKFVNYGAL